MSNTTTTNNEIYYDKWFPLALAKLNKIFLKNEAFDQLCHALKLQDDDIEQIKDERLTRVHNALTMFRSRNQKIATTQRAFIELFNGMEEYESAVKAIFN
jgi:hypothetical protein